MTLAPVAYRGADACGSGPSKVQPGGARGVPDAMLDLPGASRCALYVAPEKLLRSAAKGTKDPPGVNATFDKYHRGSIKSEQQMDARRDAHPPPGGHLARLLERCGSAAVATRSGRLHPASARRTCRCSGVTARAGGEPGMMQQQTPILGTYNDADCSAERLRLFSGQMVCRKVRLTGIVISKALEEVMAT